METITAAATKWARQCPKCKKLLVYSNQLTCEASLKVQPLCPECAQPQQPGRPFKNKPKPQIETRGRPPKADAFKREVLEEGEHWLAIREDGAWLRKCPTCQKVIVHQGKRAEMCARKACYKTQECKSCRNKRRYREQALETERLIGFEGLKHSEQTNQQCSLLKREWWGRVHQSKEIQQEILKIMGNTTGSCDCFPYQ